MGKEKHSRNAEFSKNKLNSVCELSSEFDGKRFADGNDFTHKGLSKKKKYKTKHKHKLCDPDY